MTRAPAGEDARHAVAERVAPGTGSSLRQRRAVPGARPRSAPLTTAALLGVCLLAAQNAAANPLDAFGWGARAPALGNAYAAVADDSSASYYNPAALARVKGLQIDLGYQSANPRIDVSGVRQALFNTSGVTAGLVLPGQIRSVRFAIGVQLFLPDLHVTRIHVLQHDRPRLALYDNRTQRLYLAANLSLRILPGLYLGGGLAFMSRSDGLASLRGNLAVGDPENSQLESSISQDLFAIRYPQAGILWEATRHLSLAVVYRHRFVLDLVQRFNISADVGDPGRPPLLLGGKLYETAYSVDLFQPWQLVFAAAARWHRLLVSFDLTFARWSEQPPPASTFELELDIGELGSAVDIPEPKPYPHPGYHDLLIPAVGIEARLVDGAGGGRVAIDLRGGYRYEGSPVPAQLDESNFGDADKHTVSGGVGLTLSRLGKVLPGPLTIDAFAAATVLPRRTFEKADPRSAVGDFTVAGAVWQGGVQTRWSF